LFGRQLDLPEGDQRRDLLLFRENVWPNVFHATEQFKAVAERVGVHLIHLAVRWLLHQPGVTSVLVGVRNAQQVVFNAQALRCDIPDSVFDELTAINDAVKLLIPDEGNPFGYHP
jgi:aryl-alcohol dehydrogenase-like predicted oxidoreductase